MTTRVTYNPDGGLLPFTVPFPYLAKSHVKVEVDGVERTDFVWATSSSIAFSPPLSSGELVIYRRTPADPLVEYQTGPVLTKAELEMDSLQALYRAEEIEDEAARQLSLTENELVGADAALDTRVDALEANYLDLTIPSVPELTGWTDTYADAGQATPEGAVLHFQKSSDPTNPGTLKADYMPVPRTYSPNTGFQALGTGYPVPSLHINNGNGELSIVLSEDQWPIGVEHRFIQAGNGKITVEVGGAGTNASLIYLQAWSEARANLGTYNGVYTPVIRSIGPGARFAIVRVGTHTFMANGNLEVI
jgi:hypothetical protein